MQIDRHVVDAIEAADLGKFDAALMHACFALDPSARNHFRTLRSSRYDYKSFIREYFWIIEFMSASSVDMAKTKFNNLMLYDDRRKPIYDPDFADIVYHIYRCTHAHGEPMPQEFVLTDFQDGQTAWDMAADTLRMPKRIIYALLAASVFAKCNRHVQSAGLAFLSWGAPSLGIPTTRFTISDWWGKEDDFRPFVEQNPTPRIEMLELWRLRESVGLESHPPRPTR